MSPTSLDHRAGHLSDVGLAATLDVVLAVCTLVALILGVRGVLCAGRWAQRPRRSPSPRR